MPTLFPSLPNPPYYAVIFTSQRSFGGERAYVALAERMSALASEQPGLLGMASFRDESGRGVTISYWSDVASIECQRDHTEHRLAQAQGREALYDEFRLEVCRVERMNRHVRVKPEQKKGE